MTLASSGSVTVSGDYPNFTIHGAGGSGAYDAGVGIAINGTTISNTAPDLPVTVTGGGATTVGGAYPNFIITSTYNNTTYNAGAGIAINGTTISNTTNIVAVQGSGAYAAKLCDDYTAGGFSDWYLPSLWELNLLFQNGFMVSHKLANDGNPGTSPLIATGSYWSSTQFDPTLSHMVYFPDGTPYLDFKDKPYRVRAVRRF